ncbi:MAG: UDP-N-acetylmuramoylalanine--D-glutamate ligase [Candidatus Colwellbacteria bacterium RBG_13_48_8]|uniref:UDP-N-acetylmuramoylalanine--D-glutamate ligase n=1 Tax=Candidatus Colwellbacteria bacterium RBG_13_48_8 TaxID=1797685 RepID=A0A1G1Z0B4_9BACT|nr:MAG: UDP-N-acetylmuramoylalanine--D-glutamate ligase [Candidatus Colwellbacteria bacterium RBG_13_48_8]
MRVAILGYGAEGKAVEKYLKKHEPGVKPVILDQKLDPNYLSRLREFDIVYRSPGVLYKLPEIQRAGWRGVKITSATNLFFEKARGVTIGVTGTKGKGTTSALIYEILKAAGKKVFLGGNIGDPAINFLDELTNDSFSVLELSNLQLWDIKYSPHIAVVLDIFPDHMDWHKNFREYFGTKLNIIKRQTKSDFVFYAPENKFVKRIARRSRGKKIAVKAGSLPFELKIVGPHNLKNASMAAAVCAHLGVRPDIILNAVKNYKGLPCRLTRTAEKKGVTYYNDSASTNPQTTIAAVKSFPGAYKVLIAGGKDKGLDYSPLGEATAHEKMRLVILMGENKSKIKSALSSNIKIKTAKTLKEAVQLARKNAQEGDIVVFSPGAASFDMFKNYQDRGEQFDKIVKKLGG